jgi:hypothetical protein
MEAQTRKWDIIFVISSETTTTGPDLEYITKSNKFDSYFNDSQSLVIPIEIEIQYLFNDIIISGAQLNTNDANIFVIYNRLDLRHKDDRTSLYMLEGEAEKCQLRRLCTRNNLELTKPENLSQMFSYIKKESHAMHRVVFTWDHGSIFGIFRRDNQFASAFPLRNYFSVPNGKKTRKQIIFKVNQFYDRTWDERALNRAAYVRDVCTGLGQASDATAVCDILTNEELASSLIDGLGGTDILVMMNCSMMNVNTAYALYKNSSVRYLIAPQGEINYPAYNYRAILTAIFEYPAIKPKILAKYIVEFLTIKRADSPAINYMPNTFSWAITCMDLHYFPIVVGLLQRVYEELIELIDIDPANKMKVVQRVNKCFPFDAYRQGLSHCMIDLRNLLFLAKDLSPGLNSAHELLESHLPALISGSHVGHKVYTVNATTFMDNLKPSGISIYFPRDRDDVSANLEIFKTFIAENAQCPSSFFADIAWLKMVCRYLF